jgi:S1-C subfamily serine protease
MKIRSRFVFGLSLLTVAAVSTTAHGQQLRDAFRKVNQSVVTVRTKRVDVAPLPGQVMSVIDGVGSGVLISNDGKVLTAAHVVQTADAALVEFLTARIASRESSPLTCAPMWPCYNCNNRPRHHSGDARRFRQGRSWRSDIRDRRAVRISQTLTAGHLSGRRRIDKEGETQKYIELLQTDAAVNGGNSGSPMFDMNGQVVGIVSTIMSQSGGSEGLAFATASNTAKRFLLDRKPFWSGIDGVLVTGDLAKALNLPQPAGSWSSGSVKGRSGRVFA